MDKYINKKSKELVDVIKVSWGTWGEVCDFVKLSWGIHGVHGIYHKDGVEVDYPTVRMGLVIPQNEETIIALDNDYLIRTKDNRYYTVHNLIFPELFEIVE